MIVARYEVPGKRPLKEPSRRVRYDRALLIPEVFLVESAFRADVRCDGPFPEHLDFFCFTSETSSLQYCNHRVEVRTPASQTYPTGRLFGGRFPGTSCQARHEQAIARRMATIALSLRDKSHSPIGSLIKQHPSSSLATTPRARERRREGFFLRRRTPVLCASSVRRLICSHAH
jgi:hypothetical protein